MTTNTYRLNECASAWFNAICNDRDALQSFDLDKETEAFLSADEATREEFDPEAVRTALKAECAHLLRSLVD